ncbi:MAG TPA: hypothetical protein VEB20_22700 [Azospirillaceae bacterium]|nr:hypothetical protein [Azospirillaceae bacterium]
MNQEICVESLGWDAPPPRMSVVLGGLGVAIQGFLAERRRVRALTVDELGDHLKRDIGLLP